MTSNLKISPNNIIRFLSRRWKSTSKIAEELGVKVLSDVEVALVEMKNLGLVESKESGKETLWRLTEKAYHDKQDSIKVLKKKMMEKLLSTENIDSKLKEIGRELYNQIANNMFPYLKIPSRSTSNIIFDPNLRQYVLAGKMTTRTAKHLSQIRSFTQIVWVMRFIRELLKMNKTSTLRDVYYSSEAYGVKFNDQQESDTAITDVEAVLGAPREDFKIFPEERSAIYGDLTVEYTTPEKYKGRKVNMTDNPDGVMIGPHLINSKFVKCKADKVIAIESGGMFTRFIEEEVYEKYNALLIHTAGQAPRSTRRLIRRLHYELKLPVYIFTDGDPWGCHIAMVIISGSATAAHLYGLATPDAIWMGVWATDIEKYNLPTDKFNEQDIKRAKELKKDPRYKTKFWQRELSKFLELKKKAEQQSFSRYGLTYVVDEYLPEKFKEIEEMKKKNLI
ncbi:MAG: DNA topoisomerase IV subunit A [Candidatus Odinarchaeia archaeon]